MVYDRTFGGLTEACLCFFYSVRSNIGTRTGKKRDRKPAQGFKCTYDSVMFGRSLRLRVTVGTQRAIEYAGGFDRYIYYTPDENFKSDVARTLKIRMQERIDIYPHVKPPPLNKRNPQPVPKKLTKGLEPIEVCNLNKYVFLG